MASGTEGSIARAGGGRLSTLSSYSDLLVIVLVVLVVVMMVIPLPPFLLDLLLACNISGALFILLLTMQISDALELAVFPSLLLVMTLFRLALNVSSTRLILLHGFAGHIIQAFGGFVVGGNYVVGFVVFLILVVIQFIVITRGAERVAEVAARFTLDAMPGKQMSIDADLNAGLITEDQARARRREIEREADFYGAMDGASKFVKGDAIAGIIITVINILGGFLIGVVQNGLSWAEALQKYTLLTIGDGLVAQIPALLISTATGIIITRAASDTDLGHDLTRQMFGQPRVLAVAAGVVFLFALIPGLPHLPFLFIAAALAVLTYGMRQSLIRAKQAEQVQRQEEELAAARKPENVASLLQVDPVELEIGYGLIPLVDPGQGGDLLDRITLIRRQCALELGALIPPIRIRDNMQLAPEAYVIRIKGVEVGHGELKTDHYLAMETGAVQEKVPGLATREPAFGLPALWVAEDQREAAELAGYTVVDPTSVLATHLTEILKGHAHELLGRQEVQSLLDTAKQNYPVVVEELTPNLLSVGEVQKVLQNLLREGVSIRNLVNILEALADGARVTRDPDLLTEQVRQRLAPQLTHQYRDRQGVLRVVTLAPTVEQKLAEAVNHIENGGNGSILEPEYVQQLYRKVAELVERGSAVGEQVVLLTSPQIRPYAKRLFERVAARLPVLSYNEITTGTEVQVVGMVS